MRLLRKNAPSVPAALQRSASPRSARFSPAQNCRRLAIATTSGSGAAAVLGIPSLALRAPSRTPRTEVQESLIIEDFSTADMSGYYLWTLNYRRQMSQVTLAQRDLLLFGPPGGGKSHLASAIGLALVASGWRVHFARTSDLVQKLQVARRELALESAIGALERFDLLILDDITYVTKDQAETSVLFELISARYERRSMLITANQPFGEWGKIFPDPAMTLAAVDRLVHYATIFELNVESYRRRSAIQRKQGRPALHATPKNVGVPSPRDNQPES